MGLLGAALEKRFRICPSDYFDGGGVMRMQGAQVGHFGNPKYPWLCHCRGHAA